MAIRIEHAPGGESMEKPIDFWFRTGKAGGEPKPTETARVARRFSGSGIDHRDLIAERECKDTLFYLHTQARGQIINSFGQIVEHLLLLAELGGSDGIVFLEITREDAAVGKTAGCSHIRDGQVGTCSQQGGTVIQTAFIDIIGE